MESLEALPENAWETFLPGEEKTVAALVHHVAWAMEAESAAFLTMTEGGGDTGWTEEWLDAANREQAEVHAHDDRDSTMVHMHKSAESAVQRVSGLSDDELGRRGRHMPGEPEHSVSEWIEICLIGHPREHLPAIESLLPRSSADDR
ncbi:hypothetical protein BH20CHL4_BH20CHL4_11110 [soil metagenome]